MSDSPAPSSVPPEPASEPAPASSAPIAPSAPFVPPPAAPSAPFVPPVAAVPPPSMATPPPVTSTPPPAPAPAPSAAPAPAAEGTGLQPNLAAAIASFFLLIGGIVFLILEKKDQYVRFYAMQSVFLGGVWVALAIGVAFVTLLLHGIPLIGTLLWIVSILIRLALLVGWVMLFIKAYSGQEWELPYLGKLARQQLARMTPTPPQS